MVARGSAIIKQTGCLFFTFLEAGKSTIKVPADWVLVDRCFHCIFTWWRQHHLSHVSPHEGSSTIHSGSDYLIKFSPPACSHWRLGFQHINLVADIKMRVWLLRTPALCMSLNSSFLPFIIPNPLLLSLLVPAHSCNLFLQSSLKTAVGSFPN